MSWIDRIIRFFLEKKIVAFLMLLLFVGGVVVVRYGGNPLAAIKNVKKKIEEVSPGLPQKTLPDGTVSQVKIVPFYDRTGLIYETLGTLDTALAEEILVTIIVVIIMVMHLRSSILISGLLPLAVLMCFIAMKTFKVDANIVALSGIAIAIGTMVDMGIVICENILKHLDRAGPEENRLELIFRATSEVGSAVLTAVSTTVSYGVDLSGWDLTLFSAGCHSP